MRSTRLWTSYTQPIATILLYIVIDIAERLSSVEEFILIGNRFGGYPKIACFHHSRQIVCVMLESRRRVERSAAFRTDYQRYSSSAQRCCEHPYCQTFRRIELQTSIPVTKILQPTGCINTPNSQTRTHQWTGCIRNLNREIHCSDCMAQVCHGFFFLNYLQWYWRSFYKQNHSPVPVKYTFLVMKCYCTALSSESHIWHPLNGSSF